MSQTEEGSGPPRSVEGARMTADEERFMEMVNEERSQRHLRELAPNPLLVQIARAHSREMAEKEYFDHLSPTPGLKTPMDRYLHSVSKRPAYACVGENLFYCSIVDVQRGHDALMNS